MLSSNGNPSTKNDDFTIPPNPYWSNEGSNNADNVRHPSSSLRETSTSSATLGLVRYFEKLD